ncbi:1,4-dihydroxy-2-naphthoate polyprenyltransferase [Aestuariimicrobium soli]|uniref:1,4-dihydroxy-2-naphthoate polyprenyltransferase n=1 Tax=Aestuariimicrobium soli TaxID=2035834 RepID=UPI003EBE3B40
MATFEQWLEGARPRTLPAATAPVLAGGATGLLRLDGFGPGGDLSERAGTGGFGLHSWAILVLCLVLALALQVGVNYANDYSDGVRGTDDERVGPLRLVGSKAARPGQVKAAAFACFGVAAVVGLVLVLLTQHWWLLVVGVACIAAAWFYTGGSHPYGYAGLGEVMVFLFFGLVAVCGTHYLLTGGLTVTAVVVAVAVGCVACALLVANNLRDIVGDRQVGKRTLATRLGDRGTRWFHLLLAAATVAGVVVAAGLADWWLLTGLLTLIALVPSVATVLRGASGRALIPVLKQTGQAELLLGIGLLAGAVVATW